MATGSTSACLGGEVRGIGTLMSSGKTRGGCFSSSATGPVHTPLFAPRGQGVYADPPHCGVLLIALNVLRPYALFECNVLGKFGVGGSVVDRCSLPVSLVC